MVSKTADWQCAAYEPAGTQIGALCFFADPGSRVCADQGECRAGLAVERRRVFDRIKELEAAGDPTGVVLAVGLDDPEQLLGGSASALPPVGGWAR